jgi:hypothetical protein
MHPFLPERVSSFTNQPAVRQSAALQMVMYQIAIFQAKELNSMPIDSLLPIEPAGRDTASETSQRTSPHARRIARGSAPNDPAYPTETLRESARSVPPPVHRVPSSRTPAAAGPAGAVMEGQGRIAVQPSYGLLAGPGMDGCVVDRLMGHLPLVDMLEGALADRIQHLCAVLDSDAGGIPPDLAAAAGKVLRRQKSHYDFLAANRIALLPG